MEVAVAVVRGEGVGGLVPGGLKRAAAREPAGLDIEQVGVVALDAYLQVELDDCRRVVGEVVVLVYAVVDCPVES